MKVKNILFKIVETIVLVPLSLVIAILLLPIIILVTLIGLPAYMFDDIWEVK